MKRYIIIKNQFEGVHQYVDAPDQVYFLREPHRHIFYVETKIEVFHNDRELEFIMVKQLINNYFKQFLDENGVYQMKQLSCEMIAENLISFLNKKTSNRKIQVSVFEDNENGAVVEGE